MVLPQGSRAVERPNTCCPPSQEAGAYTAVTGGGHPLCMCPTPSAPTDVLKTRSCLLPPIVSLPQDVGPYCPSYCDLGPELGAAQAIADRLKALHDTALLAVSKVGGHCRAVSKVGAGKALSSFG